MTTITYAGAPIMARLAATVPGAAGRQRLADLDAQRGRPVRVPVKPGHTRTRRKAG
jgi:hypothetical protein